MLQLTTSATCCRIQALFTLRGFRPWMHLRKTKMLEKMRDSSSFTCFSSVLNNSSRA